MRPELKDVMNQGNDSTSRISRKKQAITPVKDVTDKVKSFLQQATENPSMIDDLSRDEQQELVKNYFNSEDSKKRINE